MAELGNGRQLFWTLEADRLVQATESPSGVVLSFSNEDFRFKAEAPLTFKQAEDLALQEIGEAVQVINRTKDIGTLYATRQERALEGRYLIAPAQQVLDRILTEKKKVGQSLICGFLLKDARDESSLAILFHIDAEGESSKPQISVNPDSLEFVLTQFRASRKLDKATTEELLFSNSELLAATGGVVAYPNEPVWRGVPVRKLLVGAAAIFVATAVGTMGWAGFNYQQMATLQTKQAQLKKEVADTTASIGDLVKGSVVDFATVMSLDIPALALRAQTLWREDARLVMTADLTSAKFELWLPISAATTFYNRPSALNQVTADDHQKLADFKAPEGCTRNPLGVAGGLNETELTVTCETGNTALARYRND